MQDQRTLIRIMGVVVREGRNLKTTVLVILIYKAPFCEGVGALIKVVCLLSSHDDVVADITEPFILCHSSLECLCLVVPYVLLHYVGLLLLLLWSFHLQYEILIYTKPQKVI